MLNVPGRSRYSPVPSVRRGFTLVELLVVIGIIAVLISLLLPSLNNARRAARTTACLSNVRHLGMSYRMYVEQNEGRSFEFIMTDDAFWMDQIAPFGTRVEDVGICPEATEPSGGFGSATLSWGPGIFGHQGSYCINAWLYRTTFNVPWNLWGPDFGPADAYHSPIASGSERIPVFIDSAWVDAWPVEYDVPPPDLLNPPGTVQNNMGRVCINRHKMAVNVSFLDGHAETVPLAQLWQLQWSRKFIPTTIQVP